ncbi:MAG: hypothetical protein RJA99_5048 [Pseudomonadota bacterium]|jgi:hypothetical protein
MSISEPPMDTAASRRDGKPGERPDAAPGVPPSVARRGFDLLQECREVILQRMTEVVAQALNRMSDELTAEALRSIRSDQQQLLLDAVMFVREHRMEIENRFRRSFGDIFERRLFALDAPAPGAQQASADELSLVSEEAIRDRLSVERVIGRARSRLDPDEVLGIRARLGALLDRDWFDEGRHPVAPEAIFEALKDALVELSPRAEVRVALLDAFEPHVSRNLNGLYAAVNDRLRANQVLPKIRPKVRTTASGPARQPCEPAADAAAAAAPALGGAVRGVGPAVPGNSGVRSPGVGQAVSAAADGVSAAAAADGTYADGVSAAAAADGWGPVLDPIEALDRAMADASAGRSSGRQRVARMLSNPAVFGVADIPVSPVRRPLVASLTALQRGPVPADFAQVLPAIVERVREQGSPLDQITVEIVSMVFDYIYADRRLPDSIKQQLLRLQVVGVKAALLDRSFFARRQHPMRRLIDRISELGADPDSDLSPGSRAIAALSAVVERIVAEFDAELSIFDEALASIEALAADETARRAAAIDAVARDAARREALAVADEAARAELARRVSSDTPAFVRGFLHRWWTPVLARARAEHEGEAAERAWDASLEVADCLVWSVAPKQSEEIVRLATVLPRLIRGLRDGLARVELPEADRDAFFDELLRAHTLEIAAAKRRAAAAASPASPSPPVAVRMRPDGTVRFEPKPDVDADAEGAPTVSAADQLLAPLRRGLRIEVGDGAGARVFKLAWISPARKLFILTRHPDESLTMQAPELAFMLQRGQARVADASTALDLALGSVTGSAGGAATAGGGGASTDDSAADRSLATASD